MRVFMTSVLSLLFFSCGNIELLPAKKIDPKEVKGASETYCPAGQFFKVYENEFGLRRDSFPNPVLFGIQKGHSRCALDREYSEGGLFSWLHISFSDSCLENGTLWLLDRVNVFDGEKIVVRLKPYDSDSEAFAQIYTSEGRSMNDVRSKMGLVIYSCQ